MPDSPEPFVVRPGGGQTVQGPAGGPLTFKVRGDQSGGALTVIENVIAPGDGPPHHVHANEDEAWWIIEGHLRFKLGEREETAEAGAFVYVPRGVAHSFQNPGPDPARILVMFTPGGMEGFFDAFGKLEELDREAFSRLGAEVGMEVVGPPLR
ncbi:MAG TPA: cupin domain-containing protein [Thermoleophilaceae bacterium]|nr:cupin domain-containing protein [Thermoleophilaceae bacterium]